MHKVVCQKPYKTSLALSAMKHIFPPPFRKFGCAADSVTAMICLYDRRLVTSLMLKIFWGILKSSGIIKDDVNFVATPLELC